MIRLVACDMDGTLIPEGTQHMESGFLEVLDKLLDKDCEYYVATGRTYASTIKHFPGFENKIGIICENGALVIESGKIVYIQPLDTSFSKKVITYLWNDSRTDLLISAPQRVFAHPKTEAYFDYIARDLSNPVTKIENYSEIDDVIIKISCYVYDIEKNLSSIRSELSENFGSYADFKYTGNGWIDIIPKATGKGETLQKLLSKKNIKAEEIAVFGDGENDITMFHLTPHSFAMEQSSFEVKRHASNWCISVMETLKNFINHNFIL